MLLIAAVVALAWANSPWGDGYERFWTTPAEVRLGSWTIGDDLRHWVNDGLMTLFFLVVGLEIKREFQTGELRDRRAAALPVVAAIGGMIVPALIYLALNVGGPGTSGWGIPMATDIAFALGVLVLAARHAPAGLKPFILTLAIVDDIGAIIVIALFYAGGVSIGFLAAAAALCGVMFLLRRAGIRATSAFVALGALVWLRDVRVRGPSDDRGRRARPARARRLLPTSTGGECRGQAHRRPDDGRSGSTRRGCRPVAPIGVTLARGRLPAHTHRARVASVDELRDHPPVRSRERRDPARWRAGRRRDDEPCDARRPARPRRRQSCGDLGSRGTGGGRPGRATPCGRPPGPSPRRLRGCRYRIHGQPVHDGARVR